MVTDLNIDIYADGANLAEIAAQAKKAYISGFTTNPTLMRKSGIENYEQFARDALGLISGRPISFEVIADDFSEMERQARIISSWGKNIYVKIPVMNTLGEFAGGLIDRLSADGIPLNITAIMTREQVQAVVECLSADSPAIISVFAGRVADTGRDPMLEMKAARDIIGRTSSTKLLWASPREVLNLYQAAELGCDIITMTDDLLGKLSLRNKCLTEYSNDTVKMFYADACASGFKISATSSQKTQTEEVAHV